MAQSCLTTSSGKAEARDAPSRRGAAADEVAAVASSRATDPRHVGGTEVAVGTGQGIAGTVDGGSPPSKISTTAPAQNCTSNDNTRTSMSTGASDARSPHLDRSIRIIMNTPAPKSANKKGPKQPPRPGTANTSRQPPTRGTTATSEGATSTTAAPSMVNRWGTMFGFRKANSTGEATTNSRDAPSARGGNADQPRCNSHPDPRMVAVYKEALVDVLTIQMTIDHVLSKKDDPATVEVAMGRISTILADVHKQTRLLLPEEIRRTAKTQSIEAKAQAGASHAHWVKSLLEALADPEYITAGDDEAEDAPEAMGDVVQNDGANAGEGGNVAAAQPHRGALEEAEQGARVEEETELPSEDVNLEAPIDVAGVDDAPALTAEEEEKEVSHPPEVRPEAPPTLIAPEAPVNEAPVETVDHDAQEEAEAAPANLTTPEAAAANEALDEAEPGARVEEGAAEEADQEATGEDDEPARVVEKNPPVDDMAAAAPEDAVTQPGSPADYNAAAGGKEALATQGNPMEPENLDAEAPLDGERPSEETNPETPIDVSGGDDAPVLVAEEEEKEVSHPPEVRPEAPVTLIAPEAAANEAVARAAEAAVDDNGSELLRRLLLKCSTNPRDANDIVLIFGECDLFWTGLQYYTDVFDVKKTNFWFREYEERIAQCVNLMLRHMDVVASAHNEVLDNAKKDVKKEYPRVNLRSPLAQVALAFDERDKKADEGGKQLTDLQIAAVEAVSDYRKSCGLPRSLDTAQEKADAWKKDARKYGKVPKEISLFFSFASLTVGQIRVMYQVTFAKFVELVQATCRLAAERLLRYFQAKYPGKKVEEYDLTQVFEKIIVPNSQPSASLELRLNARELAGLIGGQIHLRGKCEEEYKAGEIWPLTKPFPSEKDEVAKLKLKVKDSKEPSYFTGGKSDTALKRRKKALRMVVFAPYAQSTAHALELPPERKEVFLRAICCSPPSDYAEAECARMLLDVERRYDKDGVEKKRKKGKEVVQCLVIEEEGGPSIAAEEATKLLGEEGRVTKILKRMKSTKKILSSALIFLDISDGTSKTAEDLLLYLRGQSQDAAKEKGM